jgi:glutamate-1-semialdehyde 2,1-aminomutase
MADSWEWLETDERIAERVRARLPHTLFDAHAHLYQQADLGGGTAPFITNGPSRVNLAEWKRSVGRQMGEARLTGGLFLPMPTPSVDLSKANANLCTELEGQENTRGLMLVSPSMSHADAEPFLESETIVGFKPYHLLAGGDATFDSVLSDYLPEWCWEVAHERELIILIHLVRDDALSDETNQRELLHYCTRFPKAKVILAHGARGFQPRTTTVGLPAIARLQNLWFDSSGLCEPAALVAILKAFGPRKLLWGSDLPINERRGKCVSLANSFSWVSPKRIDESESAPELTPTLVGLESLAALLEAMDQFCCNEEDAQDIFCNNALRLLDLMKDEENLTQKLYEKGKALIPGGTHLLSKRPEMFAPGQWPAYSREARGCEMWDMDGRHYYDMTINGIGANLLGARDPDVTRAVQRRINLGSMSSVNPAEEVELAERLHRRRDGGCSRPRCPRHHRSSPRRHLRLPRLGRLVPGGQPGGQRESTRPPPSRPRPPWRSR